MLLLQSSSEQQFCKTPPINYFYIIILCRFIEALHSFVTKCCYRFLWKYLQLRKTEIVDLFAENKKSHLYRNRFVLGENLFKLIIKGTKTIDTKDVVRTLPKSKISFQLLVILQKAPSYIFDRVLNTPLDRIRSKLKQQQQPEQKKICKFTNNNENRTPLQVLWCELRNF